MKAFYIQEPRKIAAIDEDIPTIDSHQVLVKVEYICLCGSDGSLYNGTYNGPFSYPIRFGHEWSGTIAAVGEAVQGFSPGDRVTGDCSKYCGKCSYCKKDKNLCSSIEKFGITVDGASAEYIVKDPMYLYRDTGNTPLEYLCLTEPISVAAHLIAKISKMDSGLRHKRILIYGGGGIGLGALLVLKHLYDCRSIDVYDLSAKRMSIARELGAGMAEEKVPSGNGKGGGYGDFYSDENYDIVIETTGNPSVFKRALERTSPLGIIGCLGMIPSVEIEQKLMVIKGLTLIGSIGGTGEFPVIMRFIDEHKDVVKKLITHYMPVAQVDKAIKLSRNVEESVKVALKF